MGCDIHLYAETKNNSGQWVTADKWVYTDDEGGHVAYDNRFYSGRNYNLFAMLADVRNGYGFAGVKTGEGFNPISQPRGVPDDACPEYKKVVEQWDCDGHSHSYHTLTDLLNYDWTQRAQLQGWVSIETYIKWKRSLHWDSEASPTDWSGSVAGGKVKHIELEEAETIYKQYNETPSGEIDDFMRAQASKYVLLKWITPYYVSASNFLSTTMPKLLKLAGSVDKADNVRICFFFDN